MINRKEFPIAIYKGNSVNTILTILQDDEKYFFEENDIVRIGIKKNIGDEKYILQKELNTTIGDSEVQISFTPDETNNIPICNAILEVELEFNNGKEIRTIYQEPIELRGVVNDE